MTVIGGWTRILAQRIDRERFDRDIACLRAVSVQVLEVAARQASSRGDITVFGQLQAAMSPDARLDVFGPWPDFKTIWAAA